MVLKLKRIILTIVFIIIAPSTADELSLKVIIDAQDKRMFDAFNRCDIRTMGEIFSKELEFYHDKVGVSDYESTMDVTKLNCDRKLGLVRTILPETVRVFPIGKFGALHKGKHTFCHMENGKNDCGTFEFVHIWKKLADSWQIYRVISYDH